ncbi:hypothetical protein DPMN_100717 [Dreissena polymorpha]|uniref:Uncharacterized protein n=1 Tax=Dreissena polymorpha TaxID=45954 RepID=A0A9D4LGF4_DREPO|nr:hypothetical protein DPMN_100717 [Dreissena polymorpha]
MAIWETIPVHSIKNKNNNNEADKEELLDDGRAGGEEGRKSQEELPEALRMIGILILAALLECALGFLLDI